MFAFADEINSFSHVMWLNPTSYYETNLNDFEVGVSLGFQRKFRNYLSSLLRGA